MDSTRSRAGDAATSGPASGVIRIAIASATLTAGLALLTQVVAVSRARSGRSWRAAWVAYCSRPSSSPSSAASRGGSTGARRRTSASPGPAAAAWTFSAGLLTWLLPAAAAFAILGLAGAPLTLHGSAGDAIAISALLFGAVLLSEAVPEEIVFRGYVIGVVRERLPAWWSIVVQAALFTGFAVVLRGFTGIADLSMFLGMGGALGYLRIVSGSVWTAVGFHAAFQTGSQLVLTQEVVSFSGSPASAMLALGAVPFATGVIAFSLLAPARPSLFHRDADRAPER
ncbi:lysostaphin resistance A-like protein [Nocardioides sp. SYSU DS0663]|uniref:lysostaphin resistance A-like protein n=1 Tax=Nocardioides sp. SYSU DS0663 TaxID=3416445 RepID=UPI003F4C0E32